MKIILLSLSLLALKVMDKKAITTDKFYIYSNAVIETVISKVDRHFNEIKNKNDK